MPKSVYDVLLDNIQEDRAAAEDQLISGGVKDHAQYREVVGVLRGLNTATQYIKDLANNNMEDDDDE